jgi:hypothetical protein
MSGEAKGTAGPSGRAATPAIKIMLLGDAGARRRCAGCDGGRVALGDSRGGGRAGVGKSSLMLRFCLGQFEENMVSTTG